MPLLLGMLNPSIGQYGRPWTERSGQRNKWIHRPPHTAGWRPPAYTLTHHTVHVYVSSTPSHMSTAGRSSRPDVCVALPLLRLSHPTFFRLVWKGVKCTLEPNLWLMFHLQTTELGMGSQCAMREVSSLIRAHTHTHTHTHTQSKTSIKELRSANTHTHTNRQWAESWWVKDQRYKLLIPSTQAT